MLFGLFTVKLIWSWGYCIKDFRAKNASIGSPSIRSICISNEIIFVKIAYIRNAYIYCDCIRDTYIRDVLVKDIFSVKSTFFRAFYYTNNYCFWS